MIKTLSPHGRQQDVEVPLPATFACRSATQVQVLRKAGSRKQGDTGEGYSAAFTYHDLERPSSAEVLWPGIP